VDTTGTRLDEWIGNWRGMSDGASGGGRQPTGDRPGGTIETDWIKERREGERERERDPEERVE